ncbi:MAG: hypothetical protein Q9170_003353 [Blastenia crenularia]
MQDWKSEGLRTSFDHCSSPTSREADFVQSVDISLSSQEGANGPCASERQTFSKDTSIAHFSDVRRRNGRHYAWNAALTPTHHPRQGVQAFGDESLCKLREQSNNLSISRGESGSRISKKSQSRLTRDDRDVISKAAQTAHTVMERQRRSRISNAIRQIAHFLEVHGSKVDTLERAAEWIGDHRAELKKPAIVPDPTRVYWYRLHSVNQNAQASQGLVEFTMIVKDHEEEFLESLGDLGGKVAIVTGNREKSLKGIADAEATLPVERGSIKFHQLDLSSIEGAKRSAEAFVRLEERLDIVVANAGVSMLNSSELSQDGLERMFATNHMGHFAFITTLIDLVKRTSVKHGDTRIVVTSSVGYQFATGLDYISLTTARPGDGDSVWDVKPAFVRYGNSKLANIYFANELDKRLREDGYKDVFCNSCHPGFAGATGLGQGGFKAWGGAWAEGLVRFLMKPLNTVEDASKTQTYLAASARISEQDVHGQYWVPVWSWMQRYVRCQAEALTDLGSNQGEQRKLWDFSERALQDSSRR